MGCRSMAILSIVIVGSHSDLISVYTTVTSIISHVWAYMAHFSVLYHTEKTQAHILFYKGTAGLILFHSPPRAFMRLMVRDGRGSI